MFSYDFRAIDKTPIQFHGRQSVIWKPTQPINKFSTEIFLRFQNHRTSGGIILMINGQTSDSDGESNNEYMLLEMHQNVFIFKTRIKGEFISLSFILSYVPTKNCL